MTFTSKSLQKYSRSYLDISSLSRVGQRLKRWITFYNFKNKFFISTSIELKLKINEMKWQTPQNEMININYVIVTNIMTDFIIPTLILVKNWWPIYTGISLFNDFFLVSKDIINQYLDKFYRIHNRWTKY